MDRQKLFFEAIKKQNLDAAIVTNPVNIFYLTGFRGISLTERESLLLATAKKFTLITAKLYQSEALILKNNLLDIEIVQERNQLKEKVTKILSQKNRIGFEKDDLRYGEYLSFKKLAKGSRLKPVESLVENIRVQKTQKEVENIKKAQVISQKAFAAVLKTIKVGQTEAEIAGKLEKIMYDLDAQGLAFESIVAAAKNSSRPHYTTGKTKIKKGDVLLFDFGAKYKNYCADLSRTIFIGKANSEQKNIYNHVATAQGKAIESITKDIQGYIPYHAANDHFKGLSLQDYFTHGLGHGIGLEVHERPHLRPKEEDILKEGMVFSIEPGLYMPWGGVRIEDLFVVKDGKAQILGQKAQFTEINL